jgi:hypothetical protein
MPPPEPQLISRHTRPGALDVGSNWDPQRSRAYKRLSISAGPSLGSNWDPRLWFKTSRPDMRPWDTPARTDTDCHSLAQPSLCRSDAIRSPDLSGLTPGIRIHVMAVSWQN